jgi:hypothetical protein
MKSLNLSDQTYSRLTSIMSDIMHDKKYSFNYDDVINELIDVYQDSLALSGESTGG